MNLAHGNGGLKSATRIERLQILLQKRKYLVLWAVQQKSNPEIAERRHCATLSLASGSGALWSID